MRVPALHGLIERRILANYRVSPDAISPLLPVPFRPQLVRGHAIAGICLIRLSGVRPRGVPAAVGICSENAAHRIAVEWEAGGTTRCGVYIPRRDTSCFFNAVAGGRLFPGEHHRARFTTNESADRFEVAMTSLDDGASVSIRARIAEHLQVDSIFGSLDEASEFFKGGSLGYSATSDPGRYDGLELACDRWQVRPLAVEHVASSLFDDPTRFGPGHAEFDCALVMTDTPHEWRGHPDLCCATSTSAKGVSDSISA